MGEIIILGILYIASTATGESVCPSPPVSEHANNLNHMINVDQSLHVNTVDPLACLTAFLDGRGFAYQSGLLRSVKMLMTLEPQGRFGYNFKHRNLPKVTK